MILGKQVFILLPVNNKAANIDFFQSLGYRRVADCKAGLSFSVLSDGKTSIILDEGYFGGKGIVYYQPKIKNTLNTLKSRGCSFALKNHLNQSSFQATFTSPENTKIILTNHTIFQKLPLPKPNSLKIGQLVELSITTSNMNESLHFWKRMGLSCVFFRSWEEEKYGSRAILSDDCISIGIHQTQQFKGMKLTYLDKDMPQRILEVKKSGTPTQFEMIPLRKKVYAAAGIQAPNGIELYLFKRRSYLDLMHFPEYNAARKRKSA